MRGIGMCAILFNDHITWAMLGMSQFVGGKRSERNDEDEVGSGVRKSMQSAFEGGESVALVGVIIICNCVFNWPQRWAETAAEAAHSYFNSKAGTAASCAVAVGQDISHSAATV